MATAQNKVAPINIRALEEQRSLIDNNPSRTPTITIYLYFN